MRFGIEIYVLTKGTHCRKYTKMYLKTESEWFQLIMGRIPKSLESADLEIVGQKESVCSFSTTPRNIYWETF